MNTETTASAGTSTTEAGASTTNIGGVSSDTSLLTPSTPAAVAEATTAQPAAKADAAKAEAVVPENYTFTMPEGVELDGDAANELSVLAKELKLDNATAQRVADIAVRMQEKQAELVDQEVQGWAESSKVDKEFGGDNLQQNLAVAQKAIDTFGSSELKELLVSRGLGNHPELIRFAFKVGKAISEDGFVKAGARTATPAASLEKRLYPDMN